MKSQRKWRYAGILSALLASVCLIVVFASAAIDSEFERNLLSRVCDAAGLTTSGVSRPDDPTLPLGGNEGSLGQNRPAEEEREDEPEQVSNLREQWGIEIVSVRLSAAGYMVDFRYRVVDPAKAGPLFSRQDSPRLIDEASGAMFGVPSPPKAGPLRTMRSPQAGRIYFILFGNPGAYVKRDSRVTIQIGDFKAEHLVVE